MPGGIDGIKISQSDLDLLNDFAVQTKKLFQAGGGVPEATAAAAELLEKAGLPVLEAPAGPLSLDTLLKAIGDEVRRQACRDGVDSLEAKAKEQKEINDKELEEIAKRLEKMKEKSVLDGFLKAFHIIGTIVGAIASAATIAVGVITANPLLVAAGVCAAVSTIDSVVSLASDGKYSIAAGFTELGKKMGMSDEAAQWFGFGVNMAIMVTSIALSFGAAAAASSSALVESGAQISEKAAKIITVSNKAANIVSGVNSVGQGSATIANAVVDYQISNSRATSKDLEAILERIRQSIEMDRDLVEAEMARANELLAGVKEIVDQCNEAQSAILTTNPAMA